MPPASPRPRATFRIRKSSWSFLACCCRCSWARSTTRFSASALPTIGREFGDVHNLPWLITAYLIANTAVTALYGKISDIHGRRVTLLIAISHVHGWARWSARSRPTCSCSSSDACCTAWAAAVSPRPAWSCWATSPRRATAASTTAISPPPTPPPAPAGRRSAAFIAEYLHWSVIFWMNIPLGLIAMALTLTLLRRLPRHERPHRLDFLGAVLIMTASVVVHAGAEHGRRALSLDLAADPALFAVRARRRNRLRRAAAHRAGAADPALDSVRSRSRGCAIVANAFGWGSDRRPAYLPADVSAKSSRPLRHDRGIESHGAHGRAQHQRRLRQSDPAACAALQDRADARSRIGDGFGIGAGVAGGEPESVAVRGAARPDRHRLWCAASARLHRAAEYGFDPSLSAPRSPPCNSRAACSPRS